MTLIYEYAPPSQAFLKGYWFFSAICGVFALWFGLKMPWISYGVIVFLGDDEEDRAFGNLFPAMIAGAFAALFGLFAFYQQGKAQKPVSEEYVLSLPVQKGVVNKVETFAIPARREGKTKWCISSFTIDEVKFELNPRQRLRSFCESHPPTEIAETDYLEVTHDNGHIYKIERRRQK